MTINSIRISDENESPDREYLRRIVVALEEKAKVIRMILSDGPIQPVQSAGDRHWFDVEPNDEILLDNPYAYYRIKP